MGMVECLWEDKGHVTVHSHVIDDTLQNPKVQLILLMTREGKCVCKAPSFMGCLCKSPREFTNTAGDPSNPDDCGMATTGPLRFYYNSRVRGSCPPPTGGTIHGGTPDCKGSLPPHLIIKRVDLEVTVNDWRRNFDNINLDSEQAERCASLNTAGNPLACWINACGGMDCGDNANHCGPTQAQVMGLLGSKIRDEICEMIEEQPYRLNDCSEGGSSTLSAADIDANNRKVLDELDPTFRAKIELQLL